MTHRSILVPLVAVLLAAPLSAQTGAPSSAAVILTATDIKAGIAATDTAPVIDRVLRLVPIGNEYNVSVSVVRRRLVGGETPPDALSHAEITEVYQILEGRAVIVTGGQLVDSRALDPTGAVVRNLIGPSTRGTSILGGVSRTVGPGDVVVIPPGTAHGFREIQGDQVRYLVLRVDPHRVLQSR